MSKDEIEALINSPASFGKLNVILYFKAVQIYFDQFCNDVVRLFQPDEIYCSLFDLDDMEMKDIEFSAVSIQYSNSIIRVILHKGKDQIILEFYQDQIIFKHLFRLENIRTVKGYSIMQKYHKEKPYSILALGFELSIKISSFSSSLEENIFDQSMHPIFVVRNSNEHSFLIEEYISDDSGVNNQKTGVMREYLKLIGIV